MTGNILQVVSIKSILIGALTNLVASWVLGFILLAAAMTSLDPGADNFGSGSVGTALYLLTLGLPPLMAGYVAAAVARKGELINGTLTGVLYASVVLVFDLVLPQEWAIDVAYLIALAPFPVLSFIGACLYLVFGWPKRR